MGKLAATLALTVISLSAVGIAWLDEPLPDGITDADADALAARMMASTGAEAWERTAAVTWTYADRYTHLWDRERHLVRVRRGTWEAQVDLARQVGVAFEDGVPLEGVAREEAVAEGYAAWANDSFWLQAANKAFDGGTTRSRVARGRRHPPLRQPLHLEGRTLPLADLRLSPLQMRSQPRR